MRPDSILFLCAGFVALILLVVWVMFKLDDKLNECWDKENKDKDGDQYGGTP